MKKFKNSSLFAIIILIAGALSISSCKKDSTADNTPSINFVGGNGFISTDTQVDSGSVIMVGINAAANANTGTKLVDCKVTLTVNNITKQIKDSTINISNFSYEFVGTVNWKGAGRLVISVTDKDGESNEVAVNITSVKVSTLTKYSSLQMGGSTSSFGSYLDADAGVVYKLADLSNTT